MVEISDVQSTNGTYVNGKRIESGMGVRHGLRDRDIVAFGSFKKNDKLAMSEIKYQLDMKHEVADRIFRYGLDLKAQEAERRRISTSTTQDVHPPAVTAAEIEKNVKWDQVLSIKSALRSLRVNSKTPGETGEARLNILRERLQTALSQML